MVGSKAEKGGIAKDGALLGSDFTNILDRKKVPKWSELWLAPMSPNSP